MEKQVIWKRNNCLKIYTKVGDRGNTHTYSGQKVPKDHDIVEVMGCIDSLLSSLDACILKAKEHEEELEEIQRILWQTAGELSLKDQGKNVKKIVEEKDIAYLEDYIDTNNPEISHFVRFRTEAGVRLNEARVRCRRLERRLVTLLKNNDVRDIVFKYINRLSDFLYVLSCEVEEELRPHKE